MTQKEMSVVVQFVYQFPLLGVGVWVGQAKTFQLKLGPNVTRLKVLSPIAQLLKKVFTGVLFEPRIAFFQFPIEMALCFGRVIFPPAITISTLSSSGGKMHICFPETCLLVTNLAKKWIIFRDRENIYLSLSNRPVDVRLPVRGCILEVL